MGVGVGVGVGQAEAKAMGMAWQAGRQAGSLPPGHRHKTGRPPSVLPTLPLPLLRAWSSGRAGASGTLVRLRTLHGMCGD